VAAEQADEAVPADAHGGSGPPRRNGMDHEEFRAAGHALVDWVADHLEGLRDRPVTPAVGPGAVRRSLAPSPPDHGEPFDRLLGDLDLLVPGLVEWQHPRWFAYFPTGASAPSILAEFAAAALGQQGMLWATSPAATELELHVLDWLVDLLGLPQGWRSEGPGGGVLQHSASDATLTALVAARVRAAGERAAHAVVYASTQAHSSIEKGARVAGYGHVRAVPVDEAFALRPGALRRAIERDLADGLVPACVVACVGTTATTAVDPVRAVAEVAREHGLWCHVDAAYAGAAMLLPELRHHQDGLELVDSYVWNPHKWLGTNFDCSVFHVADREPLLAALSILPPYLRDAASHDPQAPDLRDWHVPLGRRIRALKLWWVLRSYGSEDLRRILRDHVAWAAWLDEQVAAHPRLELVAPTVFGLVSLAHLDGDGATRQLTADLNAARDVAVTGSVLHADHLPDDGRAFLRVSIGSMTTEFHDVEHVWHRITSLA
jgi:aromatic-L-amino-acid decarboxylase